ncbi:MAG: hypothetical protein KDA83_03090, partial [Planctomycetales bacterium]|nr:hypothetical protein [Planctomycetales bacterium]
TLTLDAEGDLSVGADLVAHGGLISLHSDNDVLLDGGAALDVSGVTGSANAGNINVVADGEAILGGQLDARGDSPAGGAGGSGGQVSVTGDTGVTLGHVLVDGGHAAGANGIAGAPAGNISITASSGAITLDGVLSARAGLPTAGGAAANGGRVTLTAAGDVDFTAAVTQVKADELLVSATGAVGSTNSHALIDVIRIDATATTLFVEDTSGGLRVIDLDASGAGLDVQGGLLAAHSPLTISSNVNTTGSLVLLAGNSAAAGDDIVIDSGAVISLNNALSVESVELRAGDDIRFVDGGIVTAGQDHLVKLVTDTEGDLGAATADSAGGHVTQAIAGATSVDTFRLEIEAANGVGVAGTFLAFDTVELQTDSSANHGNQFLADLGTNVAIDQVLAGNGSVRLSAVGSVTDATVADVSPNISASEAGIIVGQGVGNDGNGALDVSVGKIAIQAEQNVVLTSAGGLEIGTVGTVSGITSGVPGPGGLIDVQVGGPLLVTQQVSSATGSGGSLLIRGAQVQAAINAGAGSVTLIGGGADTVIDAVVTGSGPLTLEADRDVLIQSNVLGAGAGQTITLRGDRDLNGAGGVFVAAAGFVNSAGDILLTGSDLVATAGDVDAIEIAADGMNDQLRASGSVVFTFNKSTPADSQTQILGRVTSTGSGNIDVSARDTIVLATSISSSGGTAQFRQQVELTGSTNVQVGNGMILFDSTVNGANDLQLGSNKLIHFEQAVGNSTPLASLTTTGAGTTEIAGGLIATSGNQSHGQAIKLLDDATVKSDQAVVFHREVDGKQSLRVEADGLTRFEGAVGSSEALVDFEIAGPGSTQLAGSNITTSGHQHYLENVELFTTHVLKSGAEVRFDGTVDGTFDLKVDATGVTRFGAAVGATKALQSLAVIGSGVVEMAGASIETVGSQTFVPETRLLNNVSLTVGGDLTFKDDVVGVGGARDLVITNARTVGNVSVDGLVDLGSFTQQAGSGMTTLHG